MSEILLAEHLRDSSAECEAIQKVGRIRTLTILPRLDKQRKRSLLQFLYESGFIAKANCIIDLSGANLSGADLNGMDLSGINVDRTDLSGAGLGRTDLSEASLRGVTLSKANLRKASLRSFDKSTQILSPLAGSGLMKDVNLRTAALSEANLSRANLDLADLHGINLSGANLSEASLVRTDLMKTNLAGANLSRADLREASLMKANLSRTDLREADLSELDPMIASFWDLHNQRRPTLFETPERKIVDLRGAELSEADLSEADLSGTNLSGAFLGRIRGRMKKAIVTPEQLDKALSLKGTIMPDGSTHP